MTPEELYDEWTSGESTGMRPKRIQKVREDLAEAIDMPVPRRISAIESWQEQMKSQITRKLKQATGQYDETEVESGE